MRMRIGTWNLDARWSAAHQDLLARGDCDVWLLTEVPPNAQLAGYHHHYCAGVVARGHYAAIVSRSPLRPLPDPHAASAAAVIEGVTYCASILPWATCAQYPNSPWSGDTVEEMVRATLEQLTPTLPAARTVWGGDWNQNLVGGWQHVGCGGGRACIEAAILALGLLVPLAGLPHRLRGLYTIDHIAVPQQWNVRSAARISAVGLSDHDAYIIEADPTEVTGPS